VDSIGYCVLESALDVRYLIHGATLTLCFVHGATLAVILLAVTRESSKGAQFHQLTGRIGQAVDVFSNIHNSFSFDIV
jgi:hypothetical protein